MLSGPGPSPPRLARETDPGKGGMRIGVADHLAVARATGRAGGVDPPGPPPPPADETLIAALLGPSLPRAARVLPARQPQEEDESAAVRVLPAPQPHEEDEPSPAVAALPPEKAAGWRPSWRRLRHGRSGCRNRSRPHKPTRTLGAAAQSPRRAANPSSPPNPAIPSAPSTADGRTYRLFEIFRRAHSRNSSHADIEVADRYTHILERGAPGSGRAGGGAGGGSGIRP